MFRYLQHTRDYRPTYWRTTPCPHLPDTPAPPPVSRNLEDGLRHTTDPSDIPPTSLFGYVDSDWAGDIRHRRSVSGAAITAFDDDPLTYDVSKLSAVVHGSRLAIHVNLEFAGTVLAADPVFYVSVIPKVHLFSAMYAVLKTAPN